MIEPFDYGRLLSSISSGSATRRPPSALHEANSWLCSTLICRGSNLEHMHVTCGLFVPNATERGAHRTPYRLGDRFGVASAPARHRLECLNGRVIRDILHPMSQ